MTIIEDLGDYFLYRLNIYFCTMKLNNIYYYKLIILLILLIYNVIIKKKNRIVKINSINCYNFLDVNYKISKKLINNYIKKKWNSWKY